MTIKAILFDKDGTLVDFNATWFAIGDKMALEAAGGDRALANALLERAGYDFAAGRFRADSVFAAGTNAQIVDLWYPDADAVQRRDRIDHFDVVTASEGAARAVALPGVLDALTALHRRGLRLAVATNDSTQGAERTLATLGVSQLFEAAYGYDAVANPKPAPDVIIAFADMTGLKPSEIAMVGDNNHDMETGRAAGAGLRVAVLSGTGTRDTLEPLAHVVLGSIADLPGYLNGSA
ncbi:HAD-IA family hydrolase [Aliihoeflea aestuarii]|uniref:HAD family hydrolase n=1 Tax=Aliihoeflea aestuarii TaxID=453840 RepID=UPI0020936EFE|nr:HAD family hydrolase [Aliihoeflea aestuarii]MCO6389893.1 HAD-IA family hydrolase [Aliihoeflea aestuarii]